MYTAQFMHQHITHCVYQLRTVMLCLHAQYMLSSVYENEHLCNGSDVRRNAWITIMERR